MGCSRARDKEILLQVHFPSQYDCEIPGKIFTFMRGTRRNIKKPFDSLRDTGITE
jgi:hypothetical protein